MSRHTPIKASLDRQRARRLSHDNSNRDQMVRIGIGLAVHSLPVLLFYLAHAWGIPLYRKLFNPAVLEPMAQLPFFLLIVVSALLALLPGLRLKVGLVAALVLFNVWALFPENPIRGYVYCFLSGVAPLLAIWLTQRLCQRLDHLELAHAH
ncbi:hypothetical protein [Pseudomonas sp. L5B5]|uniref:hypothetical protein n=1 Tax=Pseudomonas sp. L5B5 TaxID=2883205 RepID=UPI000730BDE9|nr:hypothetical protein [Pseudomonas sp. L5B5]KTC44383.1 hypothetical protein AO265_00545 [Pseudomonas sp. ABAC61]UCZ87259.1 hypothetical protein LGQ10_13490 [Pseudomonas sp. L5B5]